MRGAGTDANVTAVLFGGRGDTGERKLDSSANDFERGAVNAFFLRSPDIGPLQRLRMSSSGGLLGGAWHLAKVKGQFFF